MIFVPYLFEFCLDWRGKKKSEMVQLYYMKHFAVVREFQGILLMALSGGPKIQ